MRLCPFGEPLTEECFRRMPLKFVPGRQRLRWADGSEQNINGTYTTTGTFPLGSSWAMNPLPYSNAGEAPFFEPPCDEKPPDGCASAPQRTGRTD